MLDVEAPTSIDSSRHAQRLPLWAQGPNGVHLSEVPLREGGRRPTFFIIGAAKAGTTALHHILDGHPEISMCPYKEPHFFSTDVIHRRGLRWYEGLFAGCEGRVCGESSTSYTFGPAAAAAPRRIHAYAPDAKLVYLVREPVSRALSEVMQGLKYSQYVLGDELPRSTEEVLAAHPSIVHAGEYMEQIERYLGHFEREQLLVVLQEDLRREPRRTISRVLSFLEVDPEHAVDFGARRNVTADFVRGKQDEQIARWARHLPGYELAKRAMPDSLKRSVKSVLRLAVGERSVIEPLDEHRLAELAEHFRPHNRRLAAFLGRDLSHWDERPRVAA